MIMFAGRSVKKVIVERMDRSKGIQHYTTLLLPKVYTLSELESSTLTGSKANTMDKESAKNKLDPDVLEALIGKKFSHISATCEINYD